MEQGLLTNVFDGQVWKDFMAHNGIPIFLVCVVTSHSHIMLTGFSHTKGLSTLLELYV